MAQQFKLILGQSGWQVTSRAFMLTWWEAIYVLYDMPFFLALAQGWTFWSGDLQMWSKWAPTNIKLFCLSNIH